MSKPDVLKFDFKQKLEVPDTLELYIYSEVCPDGYDWWTGEEIESETSANYFKEKLEEYSDVKNIIIYINSCGGSVKEGYGIYAQLKRHTAFKTVYIDGFANSIASVIAMAGDKIIMYLNSMMGIHNAMDYCFGNSAEHRKMAEDLDKLMDGNREIYLAKSNGKITLQKLTELLDAETLLTAKECLEYGFCDEIVELVADENKMTQMMQRINSSLTSQIKYFSSLKQSFGAAMEAFQTKPESEPQPQEPTPPELKPEPQENKALEALSMCLNGFCSQLQKK